MTTITVIPSRLASTRLPNKALSDINGSPMIVHVWRRAIEANLGPVIVACADELIAQAIRSAGGTAILTDPALPSGSDRAYAALKEFDPTGYYRKVVNLQGDMPTVEPCALRSLMVPFEDPKVEITTLATVIKDAKESTSESIVKVSAVFREGTLLGACADNQYAFPIIGRCIYFSRSPIPWGEGPGLHHVGLYGYRRDTLKRFCSLPMGQLEQRERLEQLRAIEAGMHIGLAVIETNPLGVDTYDDLQQARRLL
ncbi:MULTISPECIES: 3-deoxy-manno-octulosonate cytidylyltransferase [unclassified Caballeronia]|uniref:3-deoxy-manno-octulosonate cytidylyltransferase n=1 Tax=unclassified Caballeronia TaxID=2646786 RepID=UPI00285860B3|nr:MULTISPECIES: 3-deoxy-manno-octulosonate cytidylyltransferase [unclassified Caballeronia]MDR5771156.1 3-deoxy-manno-octulosonate cytidylyltransferase [Caballeronia sp. LZ002]MDR5801522.1 3-deoxy-manno-octulosonate cytidylyltransferase [Caballeronia sp. LZ001]MDR5846593.1 3-deoxy-manno-octulosonate cytidylyltransferase [Caballeronia sp. LZ003]